MTTDDVFDDICADETHMKLDRFNNDIRKHC